MTTIILDIINYAWIAGFAFGIIMGILAVLKIWEP